MEVDTPLDLGSQSLLGYLPALVIKNIIDDRKDLTRNLPYHYLINTVSLFADISGFTKLSESFAKLGRIGPEFLAFSLNRYMEQLINIISKNGGDIFKFAGDALLVIWPEQKSLKDSCRRAIQCALDIQQKLHNVEISPDKKLSIKIGLGVGEVRILFVGGQFKRAEYLIVGEAMRVACLSETKATGGDTICHESVYVHVKDFYQCEEILEDPDAPQEYEDAKGLKFFKIKSVKGVRIAIKADAYLMRTKFEAEKVRQRLPLLKSFVPAAIAIYLDIEKERWSKEIRMLTIMFINLKVDLSQTRKEEGISRIQTIVRTVQRCIYLTKGSLNKFLMDDKGSVMLIVWGLPPISEDNDHSRSVYTAIELVKELKKLDCGAYMGITTGSCFTGVCGTIGGRREYSLLGEVVNLAARHMQKAIMLGIEKKSKYEILLCEKTKNLVQNHIPCEWVCEGPCKGFKEIFQFYQPIYSINKTYEDHNIFLPRLRTHRNNASIGRLADFERPNQVYMLKNSLFMVGRKPELESFKKDLSSCCKYATKEVLLVRGVHGSGKTLFCRKGLYEFLEANKDVKARFYSHSDFVFTSSQNPTTSNEPMNGLGGIFREIIAIIYNSKILKQKTVTQNIGDERVEIVCDDIGEIIFESNCFSYMLYIEEILGIRFIDNHLVLPDSQVFNRFFAIRELQPRDPYFEKQKYGASEKSITKFFLQLLKKYKSSVLPPGVPLILVIDDSHLIDNLSCEFIREVNSETIEGLAVVMIYQDPISNVERKLDNAHKIFEIFQSEKVYIMENVIDKAEVVSLVSNNNSDVKIKDMDNGLWEILVKKGFKGNPLMMLDIFDSMRRQELVRIDHNGRVFPEPELVKMDEMKDWSKFQIPIRIEKIVGHLLDTYSSLKEIITLKFASVIGTVFSLSILHSINEFNNLTFEDIQQILYRFESKGILDVLQDKDIQQSVFQFTIPFFRDVLYQKMLIEQKNDIHLSIARLMQKSKFSYMPYKLEFQALQNHLKCAEKDLVDYIKQEGEEKNDKKSQRSHKSQGSRPPDEDGHDEVSVNEPRESLNLNNLKLCVIKELCQKIKEIQLRLDPKRSTMNCVMTGYMSKKSDKNISWEDRYLGVTQNKLFYWYEERELLQNKLPLGTIELKHLYQVDVLPDYSFGNFKNLLMLHVAEWYKKDTLHGPRKYIFSCITRENLYTWVIALNFLRVKALYDEFSLNFGIVNFPLFAIEQEMKQKNKKIKKKFNNRQLYDEESKKKAHSLRSIYNSIARKSLAISKKSHAAQSVARDGAKSQFRKMSIGSSVQAEDFGEEKNKLERILKVKEIFKPFVELSLGNLLGFMQDAIFNIDLIGNNSDIVYVPYHMDFLRNLPVVKTSLGTVSGYSPSPVEVKRQSESVVSVQSLGNNKTFEKVDEKIEEEDENSADDQLSFKHSDKVDPGDSSAQVNESMSKGSKRSKGQADLKGAVSQFEVKALEEDDFGTQRQEEEQVDHAMETVTRKLKELDVRNDGLEEVCRYLALADEEDEQ